MRIRLNFLFLVKPREGSGSVGARKITNLSELKGSDGGRPKTDYSRIYWGIA